MTRYFITGGAGFIGRAFASSIGEDDLYMSFDKATMDDLSHGTRLNELMMLFKPDWVIHLGATPGVAGGKDDIGRSQLQDVFNTRNVLQAMKLSGCKNILFASTGSVYGHNAPYDKDEDMATAEQTSFYAASKLACEAWINAEVAASGIHAVILRLGTIIGPGNAKGFIRDWVKQLKQHPEVLNVLGNGNQTKSYVHIDDLVSAMHFTMEQKRGGTYNVSLGFGARIRECVPFVCEAMGVDPAVTYGTSEQGFFGDIPRIELSNERLRYIGWTAKHSIAGAIKGNVAWLLEHPEVFG